ncbi:hypothetical protein F5887DRAFT_1076063 [Amanita rubescens]|nr:hypothetical protein F5887DRAFT_1087389 [Amanita rubescens]KAF8342457.1 hypothetical protein F5887DRAFT_1076063 [Amanita rubescens]
MNTPLLVQVESLVEAVDAIVDLIARARSRMDMEDSSLRVNYHSEMNWDGNENENDE